MKPRVLLALSVVAVLSAAAIYQLLPGQTKASAQDSPGAMPMMPAPNVTVMSVSSADVASVERLPGRTRAFRLAEIRPQVSGLLLERLFTEGEFVEQGQALYQIDSARYELDLQRAEA